MTKHNRSLSEHLEKPSTGGLAGLIQHVHYLQTLAPLLTEALPPALASNCYLANYRQGRLVIAISSQAIATRLRFILPDLRQQLRKKSAFAGLVGIDFYITKPEPSTFNPTKQPRTVNKNLNQQIPNTMIGDEQLRDCWQQLLQHATVTK